MFIKKTIGARCFRSVHSLTVQYRYCTGTVPVLSTTCRWSPRLKGGGVTLGTFKIKGLNDDIIYLGAQPEPNFYVSKYIFLDPEYFYCQGTSLALAIKILRSKTDVSGLR